MMHFDRATDGPAQLVPSRVHEAEGNGRRLFAIYHAARLKGPVIWISPSHQAEQPMLWGLPRGLAERLHLVSTRNEKDLLWSVEEALRSSVVAAVIAEPEKPLGLTEGRRLQLAAEAGQTLGLLLVRQGMGSNAAETRWTCTSLPSEKAEIALHRWALTKNKKGTLGSWTVNWDGTSGGGTFVRDAGSHDE